jgi:DNA-binding Lrp family transcriptional regulator
MEGQREELDRLDQAIIQQLNQDARRSFREMARSLGVSISTISSHVKRMEDAGIIQGYIPVVDRAKLGYDLPVVVAIRISKGKLLEVQRILARDPRVHSVYDVTGEWDSVITAAFHNARELNDFIKRVASLEHVERTNTHVVLNVVKDERRVML